MPPVWPSLCPGSEHGTPPNNLCGHNLFTPNFQDRDTNLLQKTKDFFIQTSFRARLFRDLESLRSQDTGPCLALREVSLLSCIVPKISLLPLTHPHCSELSREADGFAESQLEIQTSENAISQEFHWIIQHFCI